jgi:hypothetical protein
LKGKYVSPLDAVGILKASIGERLFSKISLLSLVSHVNLQPMKRLFLHLFVALLTFSFGYFLWSATKSQNLDNRKQEAVRQQQAEIHALQSLQLYYELSDRMRKYGCFKREQITENRRRLCDQLQPQLEYFYKGFR